MKFLFQRMDELLRYLIDDRDYPNEKLTAALASDIRLMSKRLRKGNDQRENKDSLLLGEATKNLHQFNANVKNRLSVHTRLNTIYRKKARYEEFCFYFHAFL